MIKSMYCLGLAAAAALVCGTPRATAQQAPRTPPRTYTNTIQLYSAPEGLPTPKLVEEQDKPAREQRNRNEGISAAPLLLNAGVNTGARTPARTDKKKKDKDRNWILPENDGKGRTEDDERKPSGWGWLADDIREQQDEEHKKDGQPKDDEEQEEDTVDRRDASLGETVRRNTDRQESRSEANKGYMPVDAGRMTGSSDAAGRSTGRDDAPSTSPRDPAAASSSPNLAPSAMDSKSGADTMWNSDRSWGQRSEPSTVLPLTSRALSDPSRTAHKPLSQSAFTPSSYRGPSPSSFMIKTPLSPAPASPSPSPFSPSPGISQPSSAGAFGGFGAFSSGGGTPAPMEPVKPLQPSQPLSDSFFK